MTEIDARDVLDKYIKVLQAPAGSVIRDVSELPYPKAIIKLVMKTLIGRTHDRETRQHLKNAYVHLVDFQKLSEKEREAVSVMSDMTDPGSSKSALLDKARQIASAGAAQEQLMQRYKQELDEVAMEKKAFEP